MTEERRKLLWHSNAPFAATGYAQQTALFTPRINEHYDLTVSAFYGMEGARLNYGDVMILPGQGGTFGNETLPGHVHSVFKGNMRGGLVLTLMDVWVLDPRVIRQLNCCCWVPVDHEPAPPRVIEFFRQSGAIPIAMSPFGKEQLAEFDPLYVPHGVDTKVYKPNPEEKARKTTGLPKDAFIVGMVAANKGNPSRKCFAEAIQAFKVFSDRHDDALLYLHTDAKGICDGVDLGPLIDAVGLDIDKVKLPDQYRILHHPFSPELMASIYGSIDVLLAASAGEGFGIPVLEAGACGIPAIVTDFSAQPDVLCGGWKVEYERQWSVQQSWQARPSVPDMVEALNASYAMGEAERKSVSKQCRQKALAFDADTVVTEHFLPALAEVEKRYADRMPVAA